MDALRAILALGMLGLLFAVTGLAQWLVLRHHIKRSGWWAPATFGGWTIGLVIIVLLLGLITALTPAWVDNLIRVFVLPLSLGPILGAVLGFFQWLVLRRQVPNGRRWVRASTVGVGIGFLPAAVLTVLNNWGLSILGNLSLLTLSLFGILYGWITGRAMLRLLK